MSRWCSTRPIRAGLPIYGAKYPRCASRPTFVGWLEPDRRPGTHQPWQTEDRHRTVIELTTDVGETRNAIELESDGHVLLRVFDAGRGVSSPMGGAASLNAVQAAAPRRADDRLTGALVAGHHRGQGPVAENMNAPIPARFARVGTESRDVTTSTAQKSMKSQRPSFGCLPCSSSCRKRPGPGNLHFSLRLGSCARYRTVPDPRYGGNTR